MQGRKVLSSFDIVERETHRFRADRPEWGVDRARVFGPGQARDCSKSSTTDRGIYGYRLGMYEAFDRKEAALCKRDAALLFPCRIKRKKGVWWMPRQQEAMKDVIPCDKPWGAGNRL
jgi:hypothetical protein